MVAKLKAHIEQRIHSLAYLQEVYGGNSHWVSTVQLGTDPKEEGLDDTQALRWFCLSVSLANLLQQPSGPLFVRALLQLFEEHQHHFNHSAVQKVRRMAPRAQVFGSSASVIRDADDREVNFAPSLQRAGGKVVYEYLLTPHVCHTLSIVQVAYSTCELLTRIFRKLAEYLVAVEATSPAHDAISDAISKADSYLEEQFLAPAAKHAETLAKAAMRTSLGRVDPLFSRIMRGDASGEGGGEMDANPPATAGSL